MVNTTHNNWRRGFTALASAAVLGTLAPALGGGTQFVWQGDSPTPTDWGTPANWNTNLTPDGDPFAQVLLPTNPLGTSNIVLNGDRAPFNLTFGATPYTLDGPGTLSVGMDRLLVQDAALTQTINCNLELVGSQPMQVGLDATLLLTGSISESGGSHTLTKTGAGTLQLNANLSSTGGVQVQMGTLRSNTDSNFGPGAVPLTIANGAEVAFTSGNFNTSRPFHLSGGGIVTASGRIWFVHEISGTGPLFLRGGQTFLTTPSDYTGGTYIDSFTVLLNGTGSATGPDPVLVGPNGILTGYGIVEGLVMVDEDGTLQLDSETNGDVTIVLGSLQFAPGSNYTIESFGDGDRKVLVASETTIQGGALNLLLGNEDPQPGDTFTIIQTEQLSGAFDTVNFPNDGQSWFIEYDTVNGEVVVGVNATCPGDADNDGDVDISDLALLLSQFGASGVGLPGDIDGDGDVDISDLAQLLADFGKSC